MAYLPREESVAVATGADLVELEARLGARLDQFDRRIDMVNQRLDRLFLTLGAGLLAIVATGRRHRLGMTPKGRPTLGNLGRVNPIDGATAQA